MTIVCEGPCDHCGIETRTKDSFKHLCIDCEKSLQSVYDKYDAVMQQLEMQSYVCDYGFYLTFRNRGAYKSKFYSTLDDFCEWNGVLLCTDSKNVFNREGKLGIEGAMHSKKKRFDHLKSKRRRKRGIGLREILLSAHQFIVANESLFRSINKPR